MSQLSLKSRIKSLGLCAPMLASALLLSGCDREKAESGQVQPSEQAATGAEGDDGTVPTPSAAAEKKVDANDFTIDRSRKGKAAPALSFLGDDDAKVALADYRGKPLLLNLWATWCAPCIVEMPTLDALAGSMAGKVAVIAVSQDLKGAETVDPFFAKRKFTHLKPFLDPDNALGLGLETTSLPTTILFDKDGKEVARVTGAMDWMGPEAKALLAEVAP